MKERSLKAGGLLKAVESGPDIYHFYLQNKTSARPDKQRSLLLAAALPLVPVQKRAAGWMMAVSVLLLLELSLYACCFVCGIVAAASLTIVQGNFGGLCMLYGRVSYNATGKVIAVQASTPASLCYFVSAISIMVAVVCFSLSVYWVYAFCMEGEVKRERMWLNVMVFVSGIFLFFLLITGCMLKIGRDSLCDSIIQTVTGVKSCDEVQSKNWVSPIQGTRIYTNLHKSETAVWVNFFFWIIIGTLVIVQKRQSSGAKHVSTPAGSLFGEPAATAAETEPFFNRPQ